MSKICTIITKDKKEYKIGLELLKKYSNFFDVMIDQPTSNEVEPINLQHVSSQAFDYIFEFFQLHKTSPPKEFSQSLQKNIDIKTYMSEEDAELIERINDLQNKIKIQILDGVIYLQIQAFKKILTHALALKELKMQTKITKSSDQLEQEVRKEIQLKIKSLIKIKDNQANFKQQS